MENKHIAALGIIGMIVMSFLMGVLFGKTFVPTENQRDSVAANQTCKPTPNAVCYAIECGSCGAHVYEYWYVENINTGEPVEVCEFCYSNYMENTATENL